MIAKSHSPHRARTALSKPLTPWGTFTILALLGIAYGLDERLRVDLGIGPIELPELWVLAGEHVRPWQLFSYAFIHSDLNHLLGNAASLLVGGTLLELRIGVARVVLVFLGLAALVGLIFHFTDASDLYGCSGAAAAMLAYYAGRTAMARDLARGARARCRSSYLWSCQTRGRDGGGGENTLDEATSFGGVRSKAHRSMADPLKSRSGRAAYDHR